MALTPKLNAEEDHQAEAVDECLRSGVYSQASICDGMDAFSMEPENGLIANRVASLCSTKPRHKVLIELPTEIHALLFEHIDSYVDTICLSQTCRHLCVVGHRRLINLMTSFLASWAGDGVICLGNKPTDLPPNIDIPLDIKRTATARPDSGLIVYHFRRNLVGITRFTPLEDEVSHISILERQQIRACCVEMDAETTTNAQIQQHPSTSTSITNKPRKWSIGIPFRRTDMGIYDRRWVLQNPTSGKCVTLRGIATYPRYVHDTHVGGMTCLLSVLMYRMSKDAMGW
jgi:hypothetical protein